MRKGKIQKGQFSVQPGMAFTMKALGRLLPADRDFGAGIHPWLITRVDDNYVEAVMCATLTDSHEGKYRINKLLEHDDVSDITNPCPPMNKGDKRTSYMSLDTFKAIPKKVLFSHDLALLNTNTRQRNFATEGMQSLCLDPDEMKAIRKEILQYSSHIPEHEMDPFGVVKADYELYDGEYDEDEFQKQFGWQDIRAANPLAPYPFEKDMEPYEKCDKKLVAKVRYRENQIELSEDDLKELDIPPGLGK